MKFTTECFFLTLHAQHMSIVPALRRQKQLVKDLGRFDGRLATVQREHDEEADVTKKVPLAAKLEKMKRARQNYMRQRWANEAVLMDEVLLENAMQFCTKLMNMITAVLAPEL